MKIMTYKRFSIIVLLSILFMPGIFHGQEEQKSNLVKFDFGADIVSRYIWRGIEFGGAPAVPQLQPYASLNFNLSSSHVIQIGAWGSYGFTGDYNENDLSLKYSYTHEAAGSFSIGLNDYYYPYLNIPFSNFKKDGEGAHTIEAGFGYSGPASFPVNFLISKNILNDLPESKSLYVEAGFNTIISELPFNFFVGAAQGRSAWHSVTTDKFEICNLGVGVSKSVKISSDFSLPIGMSWIMNPHQKKTYLVFKVSL